MTENMLRRYCGSSIAGIASVTLVCSEPSELVSPVRDAVIYGDDTRRDVYAVDAQLAQIALRSSVASISAEHLIPAPDGTFAIASDTLGESNNLCPGEAFAMQPAAAACSGVLIDDQLVLTAGHCVSEDGCGDHRLVFGYALTEPRDVVTVPASAVYRCKSILVRELGSDRDGRWLDYAIIELDRPVDAARRPVEVARDAPPVGSILTLIGYPSGLPAKVDSAAQLLYARSCRDYFMLSSDTFQGSSGSGVFDDRGRLVGSFVRGGVDYEFIPDRGCAVPRRVTEVLDPAEAEQASYVAPAIAGLCASGWTSTRLCRIDDLVEPDHEGHCMPDPGDNADGGCAVSGSPHDRGSSPSALTAMVALALVLVHRLHDRLRRSRKHTRRRGLRRRRASGFSTARR